MASVGPRRSEKAGALFAELTDGEYDELIVNPETYEIQLRDAGLLYGMTRFSGSETDLANLAPAGGGEQVQFQAGGRSGCSSSRRSSAPSTTTPRNACCSPSSG